MQHLSTTFKFVPCLLLVSLLVGFVSTAEAQRNRRGASKELGFQGGTMWYIGDLNPTNMFRGKKHLAYGMYYRQNINTRISVRGQFLSGTIEAWDQDHPNAAWQRRNLNFRNTVNESAMLVEMNYKDHAVGNPKKKAVPFLSAGLAIYTHNPQAIERVGESSGTRVEREIPLISLGTEGQGLEDYPDRKRYLPWGVAVPFGLGVKGNLGTGMTYQVEWVGRKVWTDYLDDVSTTYVAEEDYNGIAADWARRDENELREGESWMGVQRGDPGRDDRYGYFLFSLGFRVSKKATTCWDP